MQPTTAPAGYAAEIFAGAAFAALIVLGALGFGDRTSPGATVAAPNGPAIARAADRAHGSCVAKRLEGRVSRTEAESWCRARGGADDRSVAVQVVQPGLHPSTGPTP